MAHTLTAIFFILTLLAGCGKDGTQFVVKGEISGLKNADIYVYCEDGTFEGIDTIHVKDGKFTYHRALSDPAVVTLLFPNFSRTLFVASPGDELAYKGVASHLLEARIEGSEENELLSDFRRKAAKTDEEKARMLAAEFIRKHPEKLAALAVFRKYFDNAENPDAHVMRSLLDCMKKAQPQSVVLAQTDQRLRPQLRYAAGMTLKPFSAVTVSGTTWDSGACAGKPLAMFFLSTWSNDIYNQLRFLHRMEKEYAEKVNFLVVGIESNPKDFSRRLLRDSIGSPVVCEGKSFSSPLVKKLGVRYVPGNLVVDARGKIVLRDGKLTEIEDKLKEMTAEE